MWRARVLWRAQAQTWPEPQHGAWRAHGVRMACAWRSAWRARGVRVACAWRGHGVCMVCGGLRGAQAPMKPHRPRSVSQSVLRQRPAARSARLAATPAVEARRSGLRPTCSFGLGLGLGSLALSLSLTLTLSLSLTLTLSGLRPTRSTSSAPTWLGLGLGLGLANPNPNHAVDEQRAHQDGERAEDADEHGEAEQVVAPGQG